MYKSSQLSFMNTGSILWALLQTRWINLITLKTIICGHTYKSVSTNKKQTEQGRLICPQTPRAPPNSIRPQQNNNNNNKKPTKEMWVHALLRLEHLSLTPGIRTPSYWVFVLLSLEFKLYTIRSSVTGLWQTTQQHPCFSSLRDF